MNRVAVYCPIDFALITCIKKTDFILSYKKRKNDIDYTQANALQSYRDVMLRVYILTVTNLLLQRLAYFAQLMRSKVLLRFLFN